MPIQRLFGLVLAIAAYWLIRGRYNAMAFEVNSGNSWAGVLSDVTYLIPGIGALLGLVAGLLALAGKSARWLAVAGTALVVLFMGLVGGLSGNIDMVMPFLWPGVAMAAATIALFFAKPE